MLCACQRPLLHCTWRTEWGSGGGSFALACRGKTEIGQRAREFYQMHAKGPGQPESSIAEIRSIQPEDVIALARLHRLVFPDYFLTHMGQRFLERFYHEFTQPPDNYGLLATRGGTPVGAVIGTADSGAFYNRFYRRNLIIAALALGRGLMLDPYIRRNFWARASQVPLAVRSLVTRNMSSAQAAEGGEAEAIPARLLSIGVAPDVRGKGVAVALVTRYCHQLWKDGIGEVGLSVRPDNQRAIAFYEKTGWQRVQAQGATIQFRRSTEPELGA